MATSEFAKITSVKDETSPTPNGFSSENEDESEDGRYVSEELYWAEKLLREQRRAEQYAAQLKALGIEIDEVE